MPDLATIIQSGSAAAWLYLPVAVALGALHALEQDGEVAPGAKFETFAQADQLLALDLARDIGRSPG